MPPAFNLSQDQTLQFKSQNSRSTRHQLQITNPSSTPESIPQNQQLNFRASSSISRQSAKNPRKLPPDQEPTPIGCLIFKELQADPKVRLRCCPSSKRGALYRRFPVRQHLWRRKWQLRPETDSPRDDEPPGVGPRCWRRMEPALANAVVGAAAAGQSGTSCPGRRSAGGCLSPTARALRRGACFAPAPPGLRAGHRLAPSSAGACAASSFLMSAGDDCGRLT
jgi:hypothetical protein